MSDVNKVLENNNDIEATTSRLVSKVKCVTQVTTLNECYEVECVTQVTALNECYKVECVT